MAQDLETRLDAIETTLRQLRETLRPLAPEQQTELEKRTYDACIAAGMQSFKIRRAPPDYYTWSLEKRRKCLGAYSVHHLCKSIIVENTKWTPELAEGGGEFTDKRYPRFYCIIVQYTTKMMSHKVFKFARSQKPEGAQKHFHFNQAKAKDCARLTGSEYNGVCPIGNPTSIPIILSDRILDLKPGFIWLGGGEPDLKLGFYVAEFVEKFKPHIVDVTMPGFDLSLALDEPNDENNGTESGNK